MLTIFDANGVTTSDYANAERLRAAVWIDLLNPQTDEAAAVERALNVRLPTRSQAQEWKPESENFEPWDKLEAVPA